ncbi:MAG: 30S ribosomal protein S6 [Alphaproteobacteria bacterium]|nr:MAG: 30S ribosomal protein S6 [Alphaproteobacteria bacterium]TAF39973.1 MAG: 30S ribosomal protein S6 [Alphaproteobacteria bacterium]TAF76949.1 MAG: 30S ribosomal protein S6 [Alphaproteobacteria bacterium]
MINHYELTIVLRPDLTAQEVDALASRTVDVAKQQGVTLVKQENWGLRKLAYPINKAQKGHYVFFGFSGNAGSLAEVERLLGLDEAVMRQLTIKVDAISPEPSAPIRQDDEREFDLAI